MGGASSNDADDHVAERQEEVVGLAQHDHPATSESNVAEEGSKTTSGFCGCSPVKGGVLSRFFFKITSLVLCSQERGGHVSTHRGGQDSTNNLALPLLDSGGADKSCAVRPSASVKAGILHSREILVESERCMRQKEEMFAEKLKGLRRARDEIATLENEMRSAQSDMEKARSEFESAHQTHAFFECAVAGPTFTAFLLCLRRKEALSATFLVPKEVLLIIRDFLLDKVEAMSFLRVPCRQPETPPLWHFSQESPTTLLRHVRCHMRESRTSTNERWSYELSREAAYENVEARQAGEAKPARIFWLSATSRKQRFCQVYDIRIVRNSHEYGESVNIVAQMRSLNVAGTRWILEWIHGNGADPIPLMGMVYRRNLLRNHPTVYEIYLPTSTTSFESQRIRRRKLINADFALLGIREFLVHGEEEEETNGENVEVTPGSRVKPASSNTSSSPAPDFRSIPSHGDAPISETVITPRGWIRLHSKAASWNGDAYTLNFGNRVTEASARNSQVVRARHKEADIDSAADNDGGADDVVFQFGRTSSKVNVGDNDYALDFTYPFSPLQAFAAALGLSTRKFAC